MTTQWIRYEYQSQAGFGTFDKGLIQPHSGDMFGVSKFADVPILISDVRQKTPTKPSKMIALWNNYHALANEKRLTKPKTPLYLIKSPNCYLANEEVIRHPSHYQGKVFYEGEIGIVIGKTAKNLVTIEQAAEHIFGYICVNDVTAFDLLKEEDNFDQWTRAKGFDTFGVFGPVIETELDFGTCEVTTSINDKIVQRYPIGIGVLKNR